MGVNKALSSANITKFLVFSNTAGQTDIRLLLTEMNYEESVFDVSIRMSVTVVDAAALPNFAPITSTFDDLKLAGGEKVEVGFTDNYGNEYELEMYIDIIDEYAAADPISNFVVALPELSGCTLLETIVFRNPSPVGFLRGDYGAYFDGDLRNSIFKSIC